MTALSGWMPYAAAGLVVVLLAVLVLRRARRGKGRSSVDMSIVEGSPFTHPPVLAKPIGIEPDEIIDVGDAPDLTPIPSAPLSIPPVARRDLPTGNITGEGLPSWAALVTADAQPGTDMAPEIFAVPALDVRAEESTNAVASAPEPPLDTMPTADVDSFGATVPVDMSGGPATPDLFAAPMPAETFAPFVTPREIEAPEHGLAITDVAPDGSGGYLLGAPVIEGEVVDDGQLSAVIEAISLGDELTHPTSRKERSRAHKIAKKLAKEEREVERSTAKLARQRKKAEESLKAAEVDAAAENAAEQAPAAGNQFGVAGWLGDGTVRVASGEPEQAHGVFTVDDDKIDDFFKSSQAGEADESPSWWQWRSRRRSKAAQRQLAAAAEAADEMDQAGQDLSELPLPTGAPVAVGGAELVMDYDTEFGDSLEAPFTTIDNTAAELGALNAGAGEGAGAGAELAFDDSELELGTEAVAVDETSEAALAELVEHGSTAGEVGVGLGGETMLDLAVGPEDIPDQAGPIPPADLEAVAPADTTASEQPLVSWPGMDIDAFGEPQDPNTASLPAGAEPAPKRGWRRLFSRRQKIATTKATEWESFYSDEAFGDDVEGQPLVEALDDTNVVTTGVEDDLYDSTIDTANPFGILTDAPEVDSSTLTFVGPEAELPAATGMLDGFDLAVDLIPVEEKPARRMRLGRKKKAEESHEVADEAPQWAMRSVAPALTPGDIVDYRRYDLPEVIPDRASAYADEA